MADSWNGFLSWSGERSRAIERLIKDWVPGVVRHRDPPVPIPYELIGQPIEGFRFENSSRKDALRFFECYMRIMPDRVAKLQALMNECGTAFDADYSRESLLPVSTWLGETVVDQVPAGCDDIDTFVLSSPLCVSLCLDCGYYLAETIRRSSPKLYWDIAKGTPRLVGYHMPSVHGFKNGVFLEPLQIASVFSLRSAKKALASSRESPSLVELFDLWRGFIA